MTYDMHELRDRVTTARTTFIRDAVILSLLLIASVSVAIAVSETTVRFIGAALALAFLALLVKKVRKTHPVSLFSREIRGKNVHEHEYVTRGRRPYSRYLGFYRSRRADPTIPRGVIGTVYILEESGEVMVIDRLNKVHTDIYEDGDILCKPRGTKYPIVTIRELDRQPCPICGEINTAEQTRCTVCGLAILDGIEP